MNITRRKNEVKFNLPLIDGFQNHSGIFNSVKEMIHQAYIKNFKPYNMRKRDLTYVADKIWRRNRVLSDAIAKFSAKLAPKYMLLTVKNKILKLVYMLKLWWVNKYHFEDLKPHFGFHYSFSFINYIVAKG